MWNRVVKKVLRDNGSFIEPSSEEYELEVISQKWIINIQNLLDTLSQTNNKLYIPRDTDYSKENIHSLWQQCKYISDRKNLVIEISMFILLNLTVLSISVDVMKDLMFKNISEDEQKIFLEKFIDSEIQMV